jgi:hypothetical protein
MSAVRFAPAAAAKRASSFEKGGGPRLATGGEAIFTPQPFVLFGESVVSVNPCVNTCLLFGTSILEVFTGKIRGKWKFTYDFSGG